MTASITMAPGGIAPHRARRGRAVALAALVLLLAAMALECWQLGYPWGRVFTQVPATAAPSAAAGQTAAVFLSGDMGFNAGMGPRIAQRLAGQGIPVVAVNSLAAFAHRQTPEAAGVLVTDAVRQAAALPGIRHVMLIGQSFGAGIILAGAPHLPVDVLAKVSLIELVVPPDTMAYRATPGGLFEGTDGEALPLARQIRNTPVLCIHGNDETESLCPLWHQPNVESIGLPGAHFLHRDSALVAAVLVRAYARGRAAAGRSVPFGPVIQAAPAGGHSPAA